MDLSIWNGLNDNTLLDCVSLLFPLASVDDRFYRLDLLLCHGRDVLPNVGWESYDHNARGRVLCSVAEVAECSFYEFLCSELESQGAASELLMRSG